MRGVHIVDGSRLMVSKTKGHGFKMRGERFSDDLRGKFLHTKVVAVWNKLPEEVGQAGTSAAFKRHLDRCMDRKSLEGCGTKMRKWD